MGAIRLIKSFFEAVGEIFNPSPRNFQGNENFSESSQPSDKFENSGEWFWKELLGQRIEESEQVKEMMIEDYEARHEAEASEMPDEGQYTPDGLRIDAEDFGNAGFDADMDSDSGNSESSGYDGYIG